MRLWCPVLVAVGRLTDMFKTKSTSLTFGKGYSVASREVKRPR